jgi:hypothetical protein
MTKLHIVFIVITLFAATIPAAYADCKKDGKSYPTGTIIDGFICTPDGRWVKV